MNTNKSPYDWTDEEWKEWEAADSRLTGKSNRWLLEHAEDPALITTTWVPLTWPKARLAVLIAHPHDFRRGAWSEHWLMLWPSHILTPGQGTKPRYSLDEALDEVQAVDEYRDYCARHVTDAEGNDIADRGPGLGYFVDDQLSHGFWIPSWPKAYEYYCWLHGQAELPVWVDWTDQQCVASVR